jgi:DNA-binding IclR family transcriptional regulator
VLSTVMAHVPEKGGRDAYCTLQEIADLHGMPLSSVSRAMKALRGRNVILKPDGRIGRWRVNAWLMYNGDFDSWNTEAEADPEPTWSRGADPDTGEIR